MDITYVYLHKRQSRLLVTTNVLNSSDYVELLRSIGNYTTGMQICTQYCAGIIMGQSLPKVINKLEEFAYTIK